MTSLTTENSNMPPTKSLAKQRRPEEKSFKEIKISRRTIHAWQNQGKSCQILSMVFWHIQKHTSHFKRRTAIANILYILGVIGTSCSTHKSLKLFFENETPKYFAANQEQQNYSIIFSYLLITFFVNWSKDNPYQLDYVTTSFKTEISYSWDLSAFVIISGIFIMSDSIMLKFKSLKKKSFMNRESITGLFCSW